MRAGLRIVVNFEDCIDIGPRRALQDQPLSPELHALNYGTRALARTSATMAVDLVERSPRRREIWRAAVNGLPIFRTTVMCSYSIATVLHLRRKIHAVIGERGRTNANETEIETAQGCLV